MMSRALWKILPAALCLAALAIAPACASAQSANQQVIITWRTIGVSAPAAYVDKIIPSPNSKMEASLAVLDGNSFAPLGNQTIYWYLDDNFIGGGAGEQTISFNAPSNKRIISLRAEITGGSGLMNTAYIDMADPSVVIVAPYPNDTFATSTVSLEAVPYFFNASDLGDLVFDWSVNGNSVTTPENPELLTIDLANNAPSDYALNVSLNTTQSNNPYFSDSENISLAPASQ